MSTLTAKKAKLISSTNPKLNNILFQIHMCDLDKPKRPRIPKVLTEQEIWRENLHKQFQQFKQSKN